MIEFLAEYGMFFAKSATIVVAVLFIMSGIASSAVAHRREHDDQGEIRVRHVNRELDSLRDGIGQAVLPEHQRKQADKQRRKEEKAKVKAAKKSDDEPRQARVFVVDFDGDLQASVVEHLRREITAILQVADASDEVVVRLESPGGLVHSYGLAASQLRRIRDRQIPLTICVDKVAASGGYMMACIGQRILAAPFAVVGSIGVVAQIPNFHRLLQKHDVDIELLTAGEYKRTLTMFGENTDKAREKFQQEIEDTHLLFKEFVSAHREGLDMEQVATGEHWFGSQALDMGLVDELKTSDEYLMERAATTDVYEVSWHLKQKLAERLGLSAEGVVERVVQRWFHRGSRPLF